MNDTMTYNEIIFNRSFEFFRHTSLVSSNMYQIFKYEYALLKNFQHLKKKKKKDPKILYKIQFYRYFFVP